MAKISKSYIRKMCRVGKTAYAIAIWACLKDVYVNGAFCNFTIQRLADILGLSRQTTAKYVRCMIEMGLARREGDTFRLTSLKERHGRNFDLSILECPKLHPTAVRSCPDADKRKQLKNKIKSRIKNLYHRLLAMASIYDTCLRKKFMADLIRLVRQPHKSEIELYKKARKLLTKYGFGAVAFFKDNGITYRYLHENFGLCKATAAKVIKAGENLLYTVKRGHTPLPKWLFTLHRQGYDNDTLKALFFKDGFDHTNDKLFATRHRLYWARANRYVLIDTAGNGNN